MPGSHYDHRLKAGPYQGEDCRIIEQPPTLPDYLKVKIRRRHFLFLFPLAWIIPKNGRRNGIPRRRR